MADDNRSSQPALGGTLLKGMSYRTTLGFIKSKVGEEGLQKAIATLPDDARSAFQKGVLATEFYPFEWIVLLQQAGLSVIGGDKRSVLREMGRFSAENALTTVYKIFFKVGSPEFIIKKATAVYATYFKGGGEIRMVEESKGFIRMQIDRYPGGHPEFCRRLDGYYEMILELSGAKNIQVVHGSCAYASNPPGKACEWTAKWSEGPPGPVTRLSVSPAAPGHRRRRTCRPRSSSGSCRPHRRTGRSSTAAAAP